MNQAIIQQWRPTMGIFTRVRDIINSNINSMLDKAEDPEKLIRLMIQEMEDTLVEIRASCADVMAAAKKVQRAGEEARTKAEQWANRAQLAIDRGREDLAREALFEKRRHYERVDALEKEAQACASIVEQYQADITQLEEKLSAAREKQRILVQRHTHAQKKKRAQMDIRRMETTDAFIRFEQFENRIERMEAEADLVNFGRKSSLESQFDDLEGGEDIEKELQDLKDAAKQSPEPPAQGETGSPEAPPAS
jgi:phage shock protein A